MKITDYGADKVLRQSPELLQRYGYSRNDIDLLHAFFSVDPTVADPQRLKPLLAQLPPRYASEQPLRRGLDGIHVLGHPALFPLLLAALSLALLYPDRRVLATWLLCIASIFALAVVFRPGVLRVYLPLVSLLFLAPLIGNTLANRIPRWRWRLAQGIVVAAALYAMAHAFAVSRSTEAYDARLRRDMQDLPHEPFVVWGGALPFQSLYPPLQRAESVRAHRIEVFGVFTLAPFSRSTMEQAKGNGFLQRLQAPGGVLVFARPKHFEYLEIYCRERLGGELSKEDQQGRLPSLKRVRCAAPRDPAPADSRVPPAGPESTRHAVAAGSRGARPR
jgi:hypothetical protein